MADLFTRCEGGRSCRPKKIAASQRGGYTYSKGAIIRGDSTSKKIALVFTGDEFGDGGEFIARLLSQQKLKASFFLTGNFYRNPAFKNIINRLNRDGHYLGPHSDRHLLYCDWVKRDSLLVTESVFRKDLLDNLKEIHQKGINPLSVKFFLPPFEWYNDSISAWAKKIDIQLINYTPGTISHADYTYPGLKNYRTSDTILKSIVDYENSSGSGLNGFILLIHIGSDPKRTGKFYYKLPFLIKYLKTKGYHFARVDALLSNK